MAQIYPTQESINKLIATDVAKVTALSAIPIPFIDTLGVFFIQMRLVEKIAEKYSVSIDNKKITVVSSIISSVVTKLATEALSNLSRRTNIDSIIGETMIKATVVSVSTTAMGEMYNTHFRNGGTLENLGIDAITDYIKTQLSSDNISVKNIGEKLINNVVENVV